MGTLLAEKKLAAAIEKVPQDSFTVFGFIDVFKELHSQDWERLLKRFRQLGEGRRYKEP